MASIYVDLNNVRESVITVEKAEEDKNREIESDSDLKLILKELQKLNIHLTVVTNEDINGDV